MEQQRTRMENKLQVEEHKILYDIKSKSKFWEWKQITSKTILEFKSRSKSQWSKSKMKPWVEEHEISNKKITIKVKSYGKKPRVEKLLTPLFSQFTIVERFNK